jgi:hypothetical protein
VTIKLSSPAESVCSADPPRSTPQMSGRANAGLKRRSPFGRRWRNVIAEGARQIPGFEQFLATELCHFGPQYVCACLVLAEAGKLQFEARVALMDSIMHEKRGELVGRLCDGIAWPKAGLKVLAKLNTTGCRRSDFLRLAGYLRQPNTAKVLAHAAHLSPRILRAIWRLPDWICLPNLLPTFEEPEAVPVIRRSFGPRLWDLSRELRRGVVHSLGSVTSARELQLRLCSWHARLLSREPFPQPPISGDDRLRPLSSAAEIRREAREMRNCLHKLIEEVFEGVVYFYSWKGPQRATVLVIHGFGELAHLEVKGTRNAEVDEATTSEIRSLVEEQFSRRAAQIERSELI